MVPLTVKTVVDPRFPDFPVLRLMTDVWFEPARADTPVVKTFFQGALIDTAAPYLVIPHDMHGSGYLKVFRELGNQPYRLISEQGEPELQRFVEVGVRFLKRTNGVLTFWPDPFVRVKAFLLGPSMRPRKKVLFGLDALLESFVTHLEKGNSFLEARGSSTERART